LETPVHQSLDPKVLSWNQKKSNYLISRVTIKKIICRTFRNFFFTIVDLDWSVGRTDVFILIRFLRFLRIEMILILSI
jgi:hypothetical protein